MRVLSSQQRSLQVAFVHRALREKFGTRQVTTKEGLTEKLKLIRQSVAKYVDGQNKLKVAFGKRVTEIRTQAEKRKAAELKSKRATKRQRRNTAQTSFNSKEHDENDPR